MTVKPLPILQIINLVFGIMGLLFEWPASFLAGSSVHRSIALRLFALPLFALAAAMIYQATNPAIYYTIATVVYFWAYSEGEVSHSCCSCPSYPQPQSNNPNPPGMRTQPSPSFPHGAFRSSTQQRLTVGL